MSHQVKFFIALILMSTFFACSQPTNNKNNKNPLFDSTLTTTLKTERFISVNCPKGDVELILNPDQTFELNIDLLDSNSHQHTGQQSVKGAWTRAGNNLKLVTDDANAIIYEITPGDNKACKFKSSTKDFFASNCDLTEKK
jgi:NlpE N-terminal domain